MNWTVVWQRRAQNDLAALWNAATDRQAVADAANRIDALLHRDPEGVGAPRSATHRVLRVAPLVVQYEVSRDDCLVSVFDVRRSSSVYGGP